MGERPLFSEKDRAAVAKAQKAAMAAVDLGIGGKEGIRTAHASLAGAEACLGAACVLLVQAGTMASLKRASFEWAREHAAARLREAARATDALMGEIDAVRHKTGGNPAATSLAMLDRHMDRLGRRALKGWDELGKGGA